ncbi:MAG TPA: porin [Planctomycetota bacterium]
MRKTFPCGLLAIAVAASLVPAQEKSSVGGWSSKPGSGLKYDGGDAFGLTWTNRIQIHWTYANNEDAPDTNTFNVRRARTSLNGNVFSKNILYGFVWDAVDQGATGDGNIKQGWGQWNFSSSDTGKIGLKVGQAKTMYGMEATNTSAGLWFVERSAASRTFADTFSRGAWLNGLMAENKLRWTAGAMNTDVAAGLGAGYTDRGEETANSDNELSYVLSASFDPIGDFHDGRQTVESRRQGDWRTDDQSFKGTVGFGVALGNGKSGAGQDIESTSLNVNTAWSVNGIQLMAEYFMRTDDLQAAAADEEEPQGWTLSGGYLLKKSGDSAMQWGLGLRVTMVETDEGATGSGVDFVTGAPGIAGVDGECMEISAVLNAFYHGHSCKTQIEYTLQDVDPSGAAASATNNILRIAFQIEF